ncbi:MAG: M42 family metallopeptidase [Fervidobacterium sp.]|nr:M42 family metallopeptidase [Fervidobacterium sp.]
MEYTKSKDAIIQELISLCKVPGVSGREELVREKIISLIGDKNYEIDNIGNLIARKQSGIKSKNVILLAHMDEIGFYITGLRDDGKLEIRNVGGIIEDSIQGSFVQVITQSGVIDGVIGTVPPHLKADGVTFDKCIDVGAKSKDELLSMGISIMDYAVFRKEYAILNNDFLSARSLDDRFGCYTLIEVMKSDKLRANCTFAWTVQEEVGLKGAKALINRLSTFENSIYDLAIAVDSFACCSKQNKHIELGKGPVIRAYDNSSISDIGIVKLLIKIADENGIPIQIGTTGGGNDASVFTDYGVPMVALSVPIRYLHSQVEMLNIKDVLNLIKLIILFLSKF